MDFLDYELLRKLDCSIGKLCKKLNAKTNFTIFEIVCYIKMILS